MKKVALKAVNSFSKTQFNNSNIDYSFSMNIKHLPANLPTHPNARSATLIGKAYEGMVKTLWHNPELFFPGNGGITILAHDARYTSDKHKGNELIISFDDQNDTHGITDGGHTYATIMAFLSADDAILKTINKFSPPITKAELQKAAQELPDVYVKVRVITGVSEDSISDISRALNTSKAVSEAALQDLNKKYDWIKELYSTLPAQNIIKPKEGMPGEYDITDVLRIVACFRKKASCDVYNSKETISAMDLESEFTKNGRMMLTSESLQTMFDLVHIMHRNLTNRYHKKFEGLFKTYKKDLEKQMLSGEVITSKRFLHDPFVYMLLTGCSSLLKDGIFKDENGRILSADQIWVIREKAIVPFLAKKWSEFGVKESMGINKFAKKNSFWEDIKSSREV